MAYRVVDDYYRQAHFDFFLKGTTPFYCLTFNLDITRLKAELDRRGYSVYLNLSYFFVKAMQSIEDFRYRFLDGRIVLYDTLHMGLTVPTPNGMFSFHYVDYDSDWERFNRTSSLPAEKELSLVMQKHRNYVYFTALPGVTFTGLTHPQSNAKTDAEPGICFGKFFEQDRKLMVPVGMQVNHIFIDGIHLNALVERVQLLYDNPNR
jgi:chloramphenicol O-acetyltransferase